ncbi:hypothetical protein NCCP2716_03910 [Sporosarcina sp. NCCP-2716]|uniref:YhcN/YlaJ family sporulation lipoprotein n=1 Tax=Sporosarcina sp. NCCP-2716 TaxID=2943679 RepID=UPI00203A3A7E|nr:YhcN/YlaJ family sporulation lipoprotein [Sporosarcina sp. NCCP-2716]GKV67893.1 hypothetical protein NCCP2716_03910 [Sporosarcina sp. NCCP-2716]
MKRIWMFLAAALLIASLAACGKKDNNNAGQTTNNATTENGTADNGTTENGTTDGNNGTGGMDDGGTAGTTEGAGTEAGNDGNRVENADKVADAVKTVDGVDHASVLKMNDSVYVGATLKEGTASSQDIDEKIADKAKEATGDTDKVYVSTNPDFAKQIDDYHAKLQGGEPAQGLFDEIGDALKRIFPDAH